MKNIFKKYLYQLEKIYSSSRKLYFDQYFFEEEIPPGEKRYHPISSKSILLYRFTSISGYILITINEKEEKEYIDNLNRFLSIESILYQIIFETHPNKLKKFDRKKNIKIEI